MTPQDFEDQGFKEVYMDRIIQRAREARVAGYKENTLEMILMGRLAPIKGMLGKAPIANESVILPYVYMRQKRNINANYWQVTGGVATPGAGAGSIPASAWDVTIVNPSSTYSSTIPAIERFFLPGKYVLLETVNSVTKAAQSLVYKVVAAVNADAGGTYKATVTLEPNYSAAGFAALSAADKLVYRGPTAGQVILLANSVSDYESWCYNEPVENTNKLLTFWLQTSRETHEYSDEYLKALNAALVSGYFREFRQLPMAEQKRIQHARWIRSWLNSVFYGQRIDENQTVETYASLPQVTDPMDPTCTLEYKANALGFKTQLSDCSRLYDHQGNPLSLDLIASTGYDMKRAREADGGTVDTIDWMTDRWTAGKIFDMMVSFYKAKGVDTTRWMDQNVPMKFDNQVELVYNKYQLPPELGGYNFAVFTHPFFDDKISAAASGDQQNRQRTMWGIDWSDVQIGIAGTNQAMRQTNVADNLYNCVIKPNVHHYQMMSTTWTSLLQDPSRHWIIDNFDDSCPTVAFNRCTV